MYNVIWMKPTLACYDGDVDGDGDGDGGGDGGADLLNDRATAAQAAADKASEDAARAVADAQVAKEDARRDAEKSFSQKDLNTFLAEDRRKHQEKYEKLEVSMTKMLEDTNLQKEQRAKIASELQDLQASHRTKDQQREYEVKQERDRFTTELETAKEKVIQWETLYKSSVVDRSLQDAAIEHDAFNPVQIMGLLRPNTRMQEQVDEQGNPLGSFSPVIDFPDTDETTGEKVTTLRTPEEAVQRMKELPHLFGNLFRSNVVSGIGSGSATGGVKSGEGRIDPTKLTAEQYRKVRRENPEALGLRRRDV
jgi:hypothetical protein